MCELRPPGERLARFSMRVVDVVVAGIFQFGRRRDPRGRALAARLAEP